MINRKSIKINLDITKIRMHQRITSSDNIDGIISINEYYENNYLNIVIFYK